MKNLNSLLAVLAIFCCMAVSSAQETLIKRINCGGAQVTGADGLVYEADASNSEVSFTSNSTTMNIGYVAPLVEPYRSFRMMGRNTASEFDYTFTNLQSGQYKVILHFAEPYHGVENTGWDTRRFDIDINNGDTLLVFPNRGNAPIRSPWLPNTKSMPRVRITIANG